MSVPEASLREDLAEFVGDGVRSVIEYTETSHTVHYVRDDMASSGAGEQLDETHEALLMRDFGRPLFEDVMEIGALESTAYRFEDAALIHVVGQDVSGLYVTLDADVLEPAPALTLAPCTEQGSAVASGRCGDGSGTEVRPVYIQLQ